MKGSVELSQPLKLSSPPLASNMGCQPSKPSTKELKISLPTLLKEVSNAHTRENKPRYARVGYVGSLDDRGRKEGVGSERFPSGILYAGEWKNGLKHGKGKLFYSPGEYYEGQFRGGKKHGRGISFSPPVLESY